MKGWEEKNVILGTYGFNINSNGYLKSRPCPLDRVKGILKGLRTNIWPGGCFKYKEISAAWLMKKVQVASTFCHIC